MPRCPVEPLPGDPSFQRLPAARAAAKKVAPLGCAPGVTRSKGAVVSREIRAKSVAGSKDSPGVSNLAVVSLQLMTTPSVWSSLAFATMSAARLPEAPGRLSTTTGCPSVRASGPANDRAAMSGVEPPGKPTSSRRGRVGQAAGPVGWARAAHAPAAIHASALQREAVVMAGWFDVVSRRRDIDYRRPSDAAVRAGAR